MNASISSGLRRRSFVRSAALRSGAETIAAMRSPESASGAAGGSAHAAASSATSETKVGDLARVV